MFIASASTTVKLHEFPKGNVTHNYQPGTKVEGPIRSISWSRDGQLLALVPHSGLTEIVGVKDQLKLVKTIQDIDEPSCVAFENTTKKFVGVGTKNGQVLIYDIKSRSTKKRFPRAPTLVTHICFTAKDTHCVAGCRNGDVLLYSMVTNNLSSTFRVPKSGIVTSLRTNQLKRNLIIGGSNEGVVAVWDSNINKVKFCMEAHKAPVTSVAFSPVNTDLAVSTGADRQFCFYDIADSKCIASISVENNMTAVDFSLDGTYFVMAAQNGFIYIYDSRNIQHHIRAFEAHKSAVKHLAFQNSQDSNNSTVSSISVESTTAVPTSEQTSNRNSDLFGMFIHVPSNEVVDSIRTSNSIEGGDSFIAALGLDKNNTSNSHHPEESVTDSVGVRRWQESSGTPYAINPTRTLHEKIGLGDSKLKQLSSTPKMTPTTPICAMSPIVCCSQAAQTANNANITDIQSAAKEAVNKELRSTLEEIKADIKFQAMHSTYQMKRMLLDLQMAMVKEFIKVENFCNGIREELAIDGHSDGHSYLMEENEQLKRRVACLEQQLANLTVGDTTPNNGENTG